MLSLYFVDLHIHIGRTLSGKPVKITGSKSLTLPNILLEASERKGMDMIGIIDCHVPEIQKELEELIHEGSAVEVEGGGIQYQNTTLILGAEIELYDQNCKGPIHVLCYFPFLSTIQAFTEWLSTRMTNITLSSQRFYGEARELQEKVKELGGIFVPAHIFTPFKSMYGKGVERSLEEVFNPAWIDAVELGLSSDSNMAKDIEELDSFTFLTNSDAHSLAKIAREYQQMEMKEPTFNELSLVLHERNGRKIVSNFGLNPLLGKYYQTVCKNCLTPIEKNKECENCKSTSFIKGVSERIKEIKSNVQGNKSRPPYIHQVPLDYLPGLGPKTLKKALAVFGTEMGILHRASEKELKDFFTSSIAEMIVKMRRGELELIAGGGGKYGKINQSK